MIQGIQPGAYQGTKNKTQGRTGACQAGDPALLFAADAQAGQRHDRRHTKAQPQANQQNRHTHYPLLISQPQYQRTETDCGHRQNHQQGCGSAQPLHDHNLTDQRGHRRRHHG